MFGLSIARGPSTIACALMLLTLGGCATGGGSIYGPKPAFAMQTDLDEYKDRYASAASVKAYYAVTPEDEHRRDEFIIGRLTLYNLEYIIFLRQFTLSRAETATAFDISNLILTLSTTVSNGERSKTLLGAVGTLLNGSRTSIEKNFYDDQTSQALVAQMNAERAAALVPILEGMQQKVSTYPLSRAIIDLNAYYDAGTMQGALQGIQKAASEKATAAAIDIESLRSVSFKEDDSSKRIFAWLFPTATSVDRFGAPTLADGTPAPENTANVDRLTAFLVENGLDGLPPENFLDSGALADLRAKAVTELNIP